MTQQGSPSQSVERDGMVASRRAVLAGGLALAAAACTPASNTPPSNTAAPTAAGQSPGSLQEVSGHALYSLPQDHKWHTGGIFDSGQIQGKYSEFPSVDGRLDAHRCWSTAVGAAGQATRADSLGGSVPAVSGWRAQAARSSGLIAQGRNRSRAAPVGGVPPAWAQACR